MAIGLLWTWSRGIKAILTASNGTVAVLFISATHTHGAYFAINVIVHEITGQDVTILTCTVGMTDHSVTRGIALFNEKSVDIAITVALTIAWFPVGVGIRTI